MRVNAKRLGGWGLVFLLSIVSPADASSDLRVVEAAKNRDTTVVRALINERVDVRTPQPDGATALHWAAQWSDLDMADLLIRAGAQVNAANDLGVTPLSLACTDGNAAMVEKLLTAGANPNTTISTTGETALMTAARTGNVDAVNALLARGADVNAKESILGQTALMWAVAEKHAEVARSLIERGANVHARSTAGFTPLLFVAREGDLDTTRVLLSAGANVNEAASDGSTPLLVATVRGRTAFAEFLLEHGADPNAASTGYTALHWAAGAWETTLTGIFGITAQSSKWGALGGLRGLPKLDFVKILLAHGANPNARIVKAPPLFGASYAARCTANCGATFGLPLTASANVVRRANLDGATPFLLAAEAGDASVMRVLADAGADPRLTTRESTTPLMEAAGLSWVWGLSTVTENSALEAVKLAFELGGDVNAANAYGDTALHGAARAGMNTVIQFLVDKGAQVNVKNGWGETPLLIADGGGRRASGNIIHKDTAELLRKLGARD